LATSPFINTRRTRLSHSVSLALGTMMGLLTSAQALANEECGAVTTSNTVVCEATSTPYTGIRYDSVNGFNLILKEGVLVEGGPVLIDGNGAISLYAEDGSIIRDTDSAAPAVDILSMSGPVAIRVDQVFGGGYGVVGVSYNDVTINANYVEANNGIHATSLGDGNVSVDVDSVWATNGTAVFAWSEAGNVKVNAATAVAEGESAKAIDAFSSYGSVDVFADNVLANGDFSVGIEAKTSAGDVSVNANTVRVEGYASLGIYAQAAESGYLQVNADLVRVSGEGAMGIYAESLSGGIDVNARFVDVAGLSAYGIAAVSHDAGDVNIIADTVSVYGDYGNGITAATGNGNISIDAWVVATSGFEGGSAISAYTFGEIADININTGYVSTEGNAAYGMDIGGLGNIVVTGNDVFTFGEASKGINISAGGNVYVEMERIVTYGLAADALSVGTFGDIDLDIERIDAWGDWSQAINAFATGDINANLGEVANHGSNPELFAVEMGSDGNIRLNIEKWLISSGGNAVSVSSAFGSNQITILENAYVTASGTALKAASMEGSVIQIAGTVAGGDGYAIQVNGDIFGMDPASGQANITIAPTGKVLGRIALTGADDVVVNNGHFLTSGVSNFGAGNDVLTNNGFIGLLDERSTAISFQGLETIKNAGVISLANGRAGDSLNVSGTLEGINGGQLEVDLDLGSKTSDLIEVGKLAGTNQLKLNIVGQGSGLGLKGVHVVNSDSAQQGDELVLATTSLYRGFVGFNVEHNGFDGWTLSSDLNDDAYAAGLLPEGARTLSLSAIGAVSDHLVTSREQTNQQGVWLKALSEDNDGSIHLSHQAGARELAWNDSLSGIQLGVEASEANWQLGFSVGKSQLRVDQGASDNSRFKNVNAGLYASYINDGWFANAMLFGSKMDVTSNWNSIGLTDEGDATALSFNLELGKRFTLATVWFEPAASLTWLDVNLPEQDGKYGDIQWQNGVTAASELSLRMGTTNGFLLQSLRPYMDMSLTQIFADDNTVYVINNELINVSSDKDMTYADLNAGMTYSTTDFDVTFSISSRFGDLDGTGLGFNGRYRF